MGLSGKETNNAAYHVHERVRVRDMPHFSNVIIHSKTKTVIIPVILFVACYLLH